MTACNSFGPNSLKAIHPLYNSAIIDTMNEEFLQNIVRLRYRDTVSFLDVVSVTSSSSMGMTAGSSFPPTGTATEIFQFNAGGSYSNTPTISFAPLHGQDFVKSLLVPINIENMVIFERSGWGSKRVLSFCLERINGLDNAAVASGPTPASSPDHINEFNRLISLIDKVSSAGLILPRFNSAMKVDKMEIRYSPVYQNEIREIKRLLGLDPRLETYKVNNDYLENRSDTISIRTRSILGIFFYLSQNVDIPKEHKEAGLVTVTHNTDKSEFDWSKTAGGSLFHIRQSLEKPDNAFVAIPYRGVWFYLEDNDRPSKSTFMFLGLLYHLQAGLDKSQAPIFTLPLR